MDLNDHRNEEICKTYKKSMDSEYNKSIESDVKMKLENSTIEEPILSTTEQTVESVTQIKNYNTTLQQIYGILTFIIIIFYFK